MSSSSPRHPIARDVDTVFLISATDLSQHQSPYLRLSHSPLLFAPRSISWAGYLRSKYMRAICVQTRDFQTRWVEMVASTSLIPGTVVPHRRPAVLSSQLCHTPFESVYTRLSTVKHVNIVRRWLSFRITLPSFLVESRNHASSATFDLTSP
ncbi:hypothetical protein BDN70DRAFT_626389 [Pholiota conissans]|uniref:Uncharacterized protein n=1 Tax=Pholiota conissans TaxID=109636 RepID=A0A9P5YLP1_9AGAR|nr:hypothetical protein BDN70DRAFT_626389 [Pholiota conissans]